MSKKFLIILVAVCIVSLGVGVVIGGGLNQNNLSATAACDIKAIQGELDAYLNGDNDADPEYLYSAILGMEAVLSEYAQRAQNINAMEKAVRVTLTEIRGMIEEGSMEMTDEIYSDLGYIIEEGSTEIFEEIYSCFRELNKTVSCKPGDMLSRTEWEAIAAKAQNLFNTLRDLSDLAKYDLQKVYQDYNQAVQTIAAIMKAQQDSVMDIIKQLR
jgi:hypothetical protein